MTRVPSIRRRLSYALIGISLAWGLAVSAAVWLVVRHEVDQLLDSTLQESAEILHALHSYNAAEKAFYGRVSLPRLKHQERLVWQIVGPNEDVLLRSYQAPDRPLSPRRAEGLSSVGSDWRVYGMPFGATGRVLYVAQRGSDRRQARLTAAAFTVGAALTVGLLCGAWLRLRVRRELEPITEMSASVARFDPLHPDSRLAMASRTELVPMHDAISDLGARLAKRLASERAFSAHAAHALRTPLAGMVAQLAVAQRRSPPEAQPQLMRTREAADRLSRVVTALLTLFRSGGEAKWQPVDLAHLVAHLPFDTLAITTADPAHTHADPDLLAAALMNLLDNAVRHRAKAVTVSARREPDGTHIVVHDDGDGMSDAERERLQAALDAERYEGQTGLGLMLADMVARAHGGRLRLRQVSTGCAVDLGLGNAPASAMAGIKSSSGSGSSRA